MCTIFSLNDEKNAFAGNNEDYLDPHTRLWFVPKSGGEINGVPWMAGKYARNYCGYQNLFPQGGMNEKGLFFDFTAAPPLNVKNQEGKKQWNGTFINFMDFLTSECATVEEVIKQINTYQAPPQMHEGIFFGDATGDSAIIEGETIIRKNSHFQVSTNFYQSQIDDPLKIPCERYKIAAQMLEKAEDKVIIDTARQVLSAVHQAGGNCSNVYSQVYDLKKQIIYLYHFHNFEKVCIINPQDEWAKDKTVIYDIAELFPPTYAHISFTKKYDFEKSCKQKNIVEKKRAQNEIIILEDSILDSYTGYYLNENLLDSFNVFRLDDHLILEQNKTIIDLYPTSSTSFCIIDVEGEREVNFETDKNGIVTTMNCELFLPGWPMTFLKKNKMGYGKR